LKTFILFTGWHYYPGGGIRDLAAQANSLSKLRESYTKLVKNVPQGDVPDWVQVYAVHSEKKYTIKY